MTVPLKRWVLDASAGVKLVLPEEHSIVVRSMVWQTTAPKHEFVIVPDLFYMECANVLWKKVRHEAYPPEFAHIGFSRLISFGFPTTPSSILAPRTLDIACRYGISAYDACYVALSEQEEVPLLTADARLAEVLRDAPFDILVLGQ